MTFSVTEKEIRNGLRESYTHNPVAVTIKKAIKAERRVDVKVEIYTLDYGFIDGRIFELPNQPRILLKKFHGGSKVQPIVFELDIPDDIGGTF